MIFPPQTSLMPVAVALARFWGGASIGVYRYTGIDTTSPVGNTEVATVNGPGAVACSASNTVPGDSASYSFSTLDTSQDNSMVFSAVAMRSQTHTPGASGPLGYTERNDIRSGTGGNSAGQAAEEQLYATQTTNLTVDGSFNNAVDWAVGALELKIPAVPENWQILLALSPVLLWGISRLKSKRGRMNRKSR